MVTINLDKERHMRLSMWGIWAFEELTGIDMLQGFDFGKMSWRERVGVIWACLLHEDKDLRYDDLACMVDVSNITEMSAAALKCIAQAKPDKESAVPLAEAPPPG